MNELQKHESQKLLIVNDSPLFRSHLKGFLKSRYDLDIIELNTTRGLFAFLENYGPANVALAIIDKDLPDGNGLAVLRDIKTNDGATTFPFIVIGTIYDKNLVVEALKMGAVDIVGKPVQMEALATKLDTLLMDKKKQDPQEFKSVNNYYREIRVEIKRALRGRYDLTVFLVSFVWAGENELSAAAKDAHNKAFATMLQNNLRETDTVHSLSLTDYLLILPFTAQSGVKPVQDKIEFLLKNAPMQKDIANYNLAAASFTIPKSEFAADCPATINNQAIKDLIATMETDFKHALNLVMNS